MHCCVDIDLWCCDHKLSFVVGLVVSLCTTKKIMVL